MDKKDADNLKWAMQFMEKYEQKYPRRAGKAYKLRKPSAKIDKRVKQC